MPSLSKDVDVVLGIKEPRLSDVRNLVEASKNEGKKRTWMMFSHTHKGQVSARRNLLFLPLIDRCL